MGPDPASPASSAEPVVEDAAAVRAGKEDTATRTYREFGHFSRSQAGVEGSPARAAVCRPEHAVSGSRVDDVRVCWIDRERANPPPLEASPVRATVRALEQTAVGARVDRLRLPRVDRDCRYVFSNQAAPAPTPIGALEDPVGAGCVDRLRVLGSIANSRRLSSRAVRLHVSPPSVLLYTSYSSVLT
jgi:hypothetical protein